MTPLARLTFGALVLATLGAFFVTQRLKRSPPVIGDARVTPPYFSPGGGVRDRARIVFRLKRADTVSVGVVNLAGDTVRELAAGRAVAGGRRIVIRWNGREDDGRLAPDGSYRVRLGLGRAARSVLLPGIARLDTRPPRPRLIRVGGRRTARARLPLILRAGGKARVRVRFARAPARAAALIVTRTDLPLPRRVATVAFGGRRATAWDVRVDGRPAPPGIYRLQVRARDRAGNVGLSPARAPGIGVTVRAVAVQPLLGSHRAGTRLRFLVDSRGRRYRWAVRRTGSGPRLAHGRGRGPVLRFRAPAGRSCACELTVRAGGAAVTVPFAVTAPERRRVLVVLPSLSWAGSALTDDDGDGTPNTLDRGEPAPLRRAFPAIPAGYRANEARLLAHLDRARDSYDLTTDAALALGSGPPLAGHSGVLLAGTEQWLPAPVGTALRRFVTDGGRLASFSVGSLRRGVTLSTGPAPVLSRPTPLRSLDALSSRLGPLVRRPTDITVFTQGAGLFDTVSGVFPRWPAYEPTRSVAPGRILALAGPNPSTPVILAYRLGRGLVIRAGLPGWDARLGSDPGVSDLTDQAWKLLSR